MRRILFFSALPLVLLCCSCAGEDSGPVTPKNVMSQAEIDKAKVDPGLSSQSNSVAPTQQKKKEGGGDLIE